MPAMPIGNWELEVHAMHIDPKNHPDVPKIRNRNDLAEGLITAGIAILVNQRVGVEQGCQLCTGERTAG